MKDTSALDDQIFLVVSLEFISSQISCISSFVASHTNCITICLSCDQSVVAQFPLHTGKQFNQVQK